jgi:hypothetical protein
LIGKGLGSIIKNFRPVNIELSFSTYSALPSSFSNYSSSYSFNLNNSYTTSYNGLKSSYNSNLVEDLYQDKSNNYGNLSLNYINELKEVRNKEKYNSLSYNSNFYSEEINNKKGVLDLYFSVNKVLENHKKETLSFFKKEASNIYRELNRIYKLLEEKKDKYKKDKYSLSVSSYSEASECPVCKKRSLVKKEASLFKCLSCGAVLRLL